jgi:ribosomal protein S18 acetylase RimI-like enzyme
VIPIIDPESGHYSEPLVIPARPEMFKYFWPDVKGSYYFRNRRFFLDFMHSSGGRIYYVPNGLPSNPPFILVGNWRGRDDITALWHIKGEGTLKEKLVVEAALRKFEEGSERFVTKPLNESEVRVFEKLGFAPAYKIVLLEKRLWREPPFTAKEESLSIVRYKRKYLDDILSLDATAFDDFWRLDPATMEAVATSCYRNIFLVAKSGEDISGYAMGGANGRLGYLQRLGVHAARQREGIGETLTRSILEALRGMGAKVIMVNTQAENAGALNLYRKLCFQDMPDPRFIMYCTPQSLELDR